MAKSVVYIARKIPKLAFDLLANDCEVRLHEGPLPPTRDELLEGVAGCHGILSLLSDRIDAEVCDAAGEQLQVVSNFAVGYNNVDVNELHRRGIAVGNTPDVLTDATADVAIALMLAVARKVTQAAADARSGNWKTWEPLGWLGVDLMGGEDSPKTVGIVGMGRIGEAVARRLHGGWGMQILYTSRQSKPEVDSALSARRVELAELLGESDFVSMHVPLSEETRHLIGSQQLASMKSSAIFVNTARGEVVDQDALVDVLQRRTIFGAGLDVCTPEPLPTDHPLFALDNCIVLPHVGSATENARDAMAERAAKNILAGIAGEPLPYPVEGR